MSGHGQREATRWITDLRTAQPASAVTPWTAPHSGAWRAVPYETVDGVSGQMLFAAPTDDAKELTIPLRVRGWHAVYLGINYTRAAMAHRHDGSEFPASGSLRARLSGDETFSRFAIESLGAHHVSGIPDRVGSRKQIWDSIHDVYWRSADLTEQALMIRVPGPPYDASDIAHVANLAYVRLVPLNPAEVASWRLRQPQPDTKRIGVNWCAAPLTGSTSGSPPSGVPDSTWLAEELAPFLTNDVGSISLEVIRGDAAAFGVHIDGPDPLAAATRIAHDHGIRILVGARFIGAGYPVSANLIQRAATYWRLQRCAVRDRDGRPEPHLSLAFAEVREHWLGLLAQTLTYDVDGIQLLLQRSHPFVGFEDPVADSFRTATGSNFTDIKDDDLAWVTHKASFVTDFIREVRTLLGPERHLAIMVPASGQLAAGLDVEAWIRESLVDTLIPSSASTPVEAELIRLWRARGGASLHIWPDLHPRTMPGPLAVERARSYYEAGADGLHIWDANTRAPRASEWAVIRRLGHIELLPDLAERAKTYWTRRPLAVLGGLAVAHLATDG